MASTYNSFKYALGRGQIDLATDAFRMIIMQGTYSFDAEDASYTDIASSELDDAAGYPAAGVLLQDLTLVLDGGLDAAIWDFDNPIFPITGAGSTEVNAVVVYHDATDILVAYAGIPTHTPSGNALEIVIPVGGFLQIP